MRTIAITVNNNKRIELFVEAGKEWFEIWIVGPVNQRRTLLDHHLTHDDLERCLEYAKTGDLIWHDVAEAEIPALKHRNAIETEKTITNGTFWDYDDPRLDEMETLACQASGSLARPVSSLRNVANHLGAIALISEDVDGAEWNFAEQAILGKWTDGVVTMSLEQNHKLGWSCADRQHSLNVGERVHGHPPDWWNFAMWGMALLSSKHKCGTRVSVLRVNEQELHVSSSHPHRIADVFQRVGPPLAIQKLNRAAPAEGCSPVAGVATPLLGRLEKAITRRNPLLAERLRPGLSESKIREALNQTSVTGVVEPLIELYSWRNGTRLDDKTLMEEMSFFPVNNYQFMDLKEAILMFGEMNRAATTLRGVFQESEAHSLFSGFTWQLFPLFRDGASGSIAVDLVPSKQNRVMVVEFESDEPVRIAYGSFTAFVEDIIRANEEGISLSCFQ